MYLIHTKISNISTNGCNHMMYTVIKLTVCNYRTRALRASVTVDVCTHTRPEAHMHCSYLPFVTKHSCMGAHKQLQR